MRAVVRHGVGDVRRDEVPRPTVRYPTDAVVVEITASTIRGTDLPVARGTVSGTVLGHEAVGIVREIAPGRRDLRPDDRLVIPSALGYGAYATSDRRESGGTRVVLDPPTA